VISLSAWSSAPKAAFLIEREASWVARAQTLAAGGANLMEPTVLRVGDVVQINPATKNCFFPACLMVVTESRRWGAQGYIMMPHSRTEPPGLAFFRARWEEMEFVGHAVWMRAEPDEEPSDAQA